MISSTIKHRVKSFPEIQLRNAHRLFVFAESRSGSTWLIKTLSSHPDIGLLDEVVNPDYAKTLASFLSIPGENNNEGLSATEKIEFIINQLDGKYKGCKILFPQAVRFIDFYEFILNYRESSFIVLKRNNSIRAEISGLIANEHSRWHLTEKKEMQQISVAPAFLNERLVWRKYSKEICTGLISTYCPKVMTIEYKDLFLSTKEILNEICTFLGIPPDRFAISQEIKSNPFLLKDIILNHAECQEYFRHNPEYCSFFQEDDIFS